MAEQTPAQRNRVVLASLGDLRSRIHNTVEELGGFIAHRNELVSKAREYGIPEEIIRQAAGLDNQQGVPV